MVRVGEQLLLCFQEPCLWALSSRQPMQRLPTHPLTHLLLSQRASQSSVSLCVCLCMHMCTCCIVLQPPHWLCAPWGQGNCLFESPLCQQCLAHSLCYRRYLMNIWMNSKDLICFSTLSYKRELLRVKLTASFQHSWEPRAVLLPVRWRGCSKMVCKLSSPPQLLCSAAAELPLAQGSHIYQELHHPNLSYSLSRPRGCCYWENYWEYVGR